MTVAILWMVVLCGCARRPAAPKGIDYIVLPRDLTEPVRLVDCDRNEPPRCKRIAATFRPGHEQLVAPQSK